VQQRHAAAGMSTADMPSPPAAVARVVRMASDPEVNAEKLGAVVGSDPAFTAELLRTVNSAFYGLKLPVTSAQRAVTVLGNLALRNLAICFAVRDALRTSGFRAADLEKLWEDALRRGISARVLARETGVAQADDAFTVSLLQDFGMLAFLRAHPQEFQHYDRWRGMSPEARRDEEKQRFGASHDELAEALGVGWGLPPSITDALARHHEPTPVGGACGANALARLAHVADIACWLLAARSQASVEALHAAMKVELGLEPKAADKMMEPLAREIRSAASALGMRVSRQPSFGDVMAEANRALAQMNLSYEELTARLERSLAEREQLTQRLQEANAALERLAYFDPLTGLCNRRRYDALLRDLLLRVAVERRSVSLVMMDLDKFKAVNDSHGHAVGDAVLRMSATAVVGACRDADIKARLGGEELAVVLPDTDADAALAAAESFRAAVAAGSVSTPQGLLRVTASFGVVTFEGGGTQVDVDRLVQVLHDMCDKALYESKHAGRNRVTMGGVVREPS